MKKALAQWMPKDVIAVLIIVGAIILLLKGINGTVAWSLLAIVAGYYGIDLTPFVKIGRVQKKDKEVE